jgi:hypothetical protein
LAESLELETLAHKRRLLVLQNEVLRQNIAQDWSELESRTAWMERGFQVLKSGRVLWPILAGAAGLLLARGKGGLLSKGARVLSWLRVARRISGVFQTLRGT